MSQPRRVNTYATVSLLSVATFVGLSSWRMSRESSEEFRAGTEKTFVGSRFDPRGYDLVDRIVKQRESESFRERLRQGTDSDLTWPALSAAQVSWTWLELLQGLHHESSYQGDFSWMFSKLNTVIKNSPKKEVYFITMLGSFFYAIGRDHAGATLVMQETFKRAGNSYNPWFWCGYHSYYNLHMNNHAADCWGRATKYPGAPDYLAVLMARLKYGDEILNDEEKFKIFEKEIDPDLVARIRRLKFKK